MGICLGQAIARALGNRAGICGTVSVLPMDKALATWPSTWGADRSWCGTSRAALKIGTFDSELVADFWHAVCTQGRMNLHVMLHYGRNTHHISEAIFKGLARAIREAVEPDSRSAEIPSTKGVL